MDLQELQDLRIVVIESSEVIREGLRVAFAEAEGCQLVGVAAGGDEGLGLVLSEGPDVVLMNVTAPQQRGMGLLRTIRKLNHRAILNVFCAQVAVAGGDRTAATRAQVCLRQVLADLVQAPGPAG